tara:strand:- start:117 stop:533 length:417 start_codon:yes stop_codon:yes gene_type:complete
MSIFDSLSRSIRNVFVGSHKGDDIKDEWFVPPQPHNPLDDMPIANGSNRYAPPEKLAELELEVKAMKEAERNPRPEEDAAEWFSEKVDKIDESDSIEEEKSIHQEMYEIATAKYNPFAVGGSENIHDFDSLGGSENRL